MTDRDAPTKNQEDPMGTDRSSPLRLSRRELLKAGGLGALTVAGASAIGVSTFGSATAAFTPKIRLAATDGFIRLPGRAEPLYVFGFKQVPNGASVASLIGTEKGNTQMSAPILQVREGDDQRVVLTNLGLSMRPDLDDSHTIHWHGFRNPITFYDGAPEMSVAVPVARNFTYLYRARDAGTYMYHCHFEDVEHVQMGMNGIVFIRPVLGDKFAYNHNSTAFDREFALLLNEIDPRPHDGLLAVQEFVWVTYKARYWTINGRCYPDTAKPSGDPSLASQPISSLVQAQSGDTVLLRIANLGYEQHAVRLAGIPMHVVGQDATLLRSPGGVDTSYWTDTIYVGPGEARDVLIVAPAYEPSGFGGSDANGAFNTYYMANRNLATLNNDGHTAANGLGGMATEVRVYPSLPAQTAPNQTI
jgi:FtsP/CotA-like multicopper oxidase with cupredoxin domain